MTIRRLAKASGTLVLACGTSPCYSFTIGPVVHLPYPGRSSVGSNGVVRPRPRWAISAVSAQDVVAATALTDGGSGGPEARTNRRWIHDVKTGDKVIGYVADTTGFAAFVDVGVVRHGSKGKVVPVIGFLHQSEIRLPYALEGTKRAKDCELEVKKGIHLTAYVRDVFPNAGRLTLSLDPGMNKEKVLKVRESKRKRCRSQRRERLAEKSGLAEVGDVVEGYVRQVLDSMILVDVMFSQLSVLRAGKIRDALGGSSFIELSKKAKPGDTITVRIEHIQHINRAGSNDTKAIISFVGWGGLNDREGKLGETVAEEGESQTLGGKHPSIVGVDDSAGDDGNPGGEDGVMGLKVETDEVH